MNKVCVKCNSSCLTCKDDWSVGDKDKCITCPSGGFLQPRNDVNVCVSKCDSGFTSNVDPNKVCVKCNSTCLTCKDEGKAGDKDQCITC